MLSGACIISLCLDDTLPHVLKETGKYLPVTVSNLTSPELCLPWAICLGKVWLLADGAGWADSYCPMTLRSWVCGTSLHTLGFLCALAIAA